MYADNIPVKQIVSIFVMFLSVRNSHLFTIYSKIEHNGVNSYVYICEYAFCANKVPVN